MTTKQTNNLPQALKHIRNDFSSYNEMIVRLKKTNQRISDKKKKKKTQAAEIGRKETIVSILNIHNNLVKSTRNRNENFPQKKKSDFFHKISIKKTSLTDPELKLQQSSSKNMLNDLDELKIDSNPVS